MGDEVVGEWVWGMGVEGFLHTVMSFIGGKENML